MSLPPPQVIGQSHISEIPKWGFYARMSYLVSSLADAVSISVQVGAAVVSHLRQGKAGMARRKES